MISLITILAYVEQVYALLESRILVGKSWIRQKLGPEPATEYWMFETGDVCSATPQLRRTPTWIYTTATHTIRSAEEAEGAQRKQRLPWLSLNYKHGDDTHDFSEWVSAVRGASNIPLLTITRLAGLVFGIPVFLDEKTVLTVVERMTGEEAVYHLCGKVELQM